MQSLTDKILKHFRDKRVVRRREIVALLGDEVKTTTAVNWLLQNDKAILIKKGLYYLKSPDEWFNDQIYVNPLIVTARVHPKGVIGYHTALRCYGKAYSESNLYQVALDRSVSRVRKPFVFQNARYIFYRTHLSFGLESSVINEVRVRHFSKERILLEGLIHQDRFFGLTEFLQSIEGFAYVNPDKLLDVLHNYPLQTAAMRLGWLLEQFQNRWYVPEETLKKLETHRTITRLFLVPNKRRGNRLIPRWNLMVPRTLSYLSET